MPQRQPQTVEPRSNPFFSTARILLLALLMAAPLAFGAVQPRAWGTMAVVVAVVLVVWALGCVRAAAVKLIWSWLYLPALALLALAVVQLRVGLTMDRIGTREAVIKLVMYLLIFFLTQHLFAPVALASTPAVVRASTSSPNALSRLGIAVTIYAFAIAVFAIIQFFAEPGLLYGIVEPRWGGYVFGPYVNHNHYAGLMEMLIPIGVASVVSLRPKHPAKPFLLFAVFICLVSVILSGSRGGMIALVVEFVIFGVVAFRTSAQRSRLLLVGLGVAALAGVFFSYLDPGDVWKRWQDAANTPELATIARQQMAIDSLRLSRDHLAHGVGLGAFEAAYPRYQTYVTDLAIDYAHNDYAQFFAEAGALGWVLTPVAIVIFLVVAFRRMGSRTARPEGWLPLGAAVGVCGVLVHSFSDFNLHIAANAAWFAVCCGLVAGNGRLRHNLMQTG